MIERITYYTIDQLIAACLARTIRDGDTVFNGVAVPLPFTAIMLARKTHAPNSVFNLEKNGNSKGGIHA